MYRHRVGSTRDAVVSLELWPPISPSGVRDVLDWPHWGLFILRWWLWTSFDQQIPCRMGQNQWAPAHPSHSFPITSRGRVYNSCDRGHVPYEWNLVPNLIWSVSLTTQLPGYDPLNVGCHHQGPIHLTDLRMMCLHTSANIPILHFLQEGGWMWIWFLIDWEWWTGIEVKVDNRG